MLYKPSSKLPCDVWPTTSDSIVLFSQQKNNKQNIHCSQNIVHKICEKKNKTN